MSYSKSGHGVTALMFGRSIAIPGSPGAGWPGAGAARIVSRLEIEVENHGVRTHKPETHKSEMRTVVLENSDSRGGVRVLASGRPRRLEVVG
jgi:hypothetical protein